jgi:hypothetical protein
MRLYARLTWQAKDPSALAGELARRLDVPARPGGLAPGARLLDLGTALLEIRPWIREGPSDDPRTPGRLMLEPVPDGEDPPPASAATGRTGTGMTLLGFGWSTVELDRTEDELSMWLGDRPADADGADEHLGARTRLRESGGLPGEWTVLLEPTTEGRAAASLARDGEGPCVIYLAPAAGLDAWVAAARERGVTVGGGREGPFGEQVILAGAPTGPHVIVCAGRTPVSAERRTGTIAP